MVEDDPQTRGSFARRLPGRLRAGHKGDPDVAGCIGRSNWGRPEPVGTLAPLTIGVDEAAVTVDVSGAFRNAEGDGLTYRATSSARAVAAVTATGARRWWRR